jgi:hypothetical protein
LAWIGCQGETGSSQSKFINVSHLKHLSRDIHLNGFEGRIIHIYAEFPDYKIVGAPGEGVVCIDDAARAAVFYIRHFLHYAKQNSLAEAKKLLNFILYMQARNGLFYNFLDEDHRINRSHKNSINRPGWWSWRAIWALSEAYPVFRDVNPLYAESLSASIKKTFPAIEKILASYPVLQDSTNISLPSWLPYQTAADQAAVMIMALVPYYRLTGESKARDFLIKLSEGIITMQTDQSSHFCFLSWKNRWHAYGNSQAYALLLAGEMLKNRSFINHALKEIDNFYPYLVESEYLSSFQVSESDDGIPTMVNVRQFPQIAYDIRPMVWASLKAYDVTGEIKYAEQGATIAGWLFGDNITQKQIYQVATGRCFDGIIAPDKINKNSGAESTIEALLTLLEIEKNDISLRRLTQNMNFYGNE